MGLLWAWLCTIFFFGLKVEHINIYIYNLRVFLILWLRVFLIQSKYKKLLLLFIYLLIFRSGCFWVARGVATATNYTTTPGKIVFQIMWSWCKQYMQYILRSQHLLNGVLLTNIIACMLSTNYSTDACPPDLWPKNSLPRATSVWQYTLQNLDKTITTDNQQNTAC